MNRSPKPQRQQRFFNLLASLVRAPFGQWGSLVLSLVFAAQVHGEPSGLKLIRDAEVKRAVKDRLMQEYKPQIEQATGNLYRFRVESTEKLKRDSTKLGGTWTGGGGSGVACFKKNADELKDIQGFLLPDAYEQMFMLTTLDFAEDSVTPFIPAREGETPLAYIRRVIQDNYQRPLPLFSTKLMQLSEILYAEMLAQMSEYERTKQLNPQPTLRDFGQPMIFKEMGFPEQCGVVQLATRMAKVDLHQVENFFIDFDVPLVLRLQTLAKSPAEGVVQTATLVLHEALYLMGSAIEHLDSSATTFRVIPLLLAQKTSATLKAMSRVQAAQLLHDQMGQFGMKNYHFVQLAGEEMGRGPVQQKHLAAIPQITKGLRQAEDRFMRAYGRPSYGLRETQAYLKLLVEELASETDETGAFLMMASLVVFNGEYILDDLFLDEVRPELAITDLCSQIRQQRVRILGEHPERNILRIYERALRYCQ